MDILAWIENNALVTWVREAPTVLAYPTVLAIHTFGLIFLVGPNVAIDLRIFGFAPNVPLRPMYHQSAFLAAGVTVCLLEVMKTFHRVTYGGADVPPRARVRELLVADGADVNQGDALLALEPI
jgi:acetyl-CoA carboxylase biotin carboxyl carrier protein